MGMTKPLGRQSSGLIVIPFFSRKLCQFAYMNVSVPEKRNKEFQSINQSMGYKLTSRNS